MKEEKGRTERGGLKERKMEAGEMCGDEKYGERLVNIYNYRKRIEEGEPVDLHRHGFTAMQWIFLCS